MGWCTDFRKDVRRYRGGPRPTSSLGAFMRTQALWACLQYRIAHAVYQSSLPGPFKRPLGLGLGIWQKTVEILTGISLPKSAEIGGGLYMPHGGRVVVAAPARLGEGCTLAHGTTIGMNWGEERGAPVIGDSVVVGPNAVVVGPIRVGDSATIGACSVVFKDVPAGARVRPALCDIHIPPS